MKKILRFVTVAAVILLFAACGKNHEKIVLPNVEKVTSVVITEVATEKEDAYTEREWIEIFINELSQSEKTDKESIQDIPSQEGMYRIDLLQGDAASSLFFYADYDGYYVEQPYQGIYKVNDTVRAIIKGEI